MNYTENENGLMQVTCLSSEVPTVIRFLTVRAAQIEEEKAMKAVKEEEIEKSLSKLSD